MALYLVVALAGAGTMVVELSAVRLLAPWFGTSSAVWTNVIGVVLLALALGYLVGARLAARPEPMRALAWALASAAGLTVLLPSVAAPIAELFLPEGVALDRAASLFRWGSFAASILLFGPVAGALGCVGPLAVEVAARGGRVHAGVAGGRVLCASTLGSLLGTFGTTHYALPLLGLRWTFIGAAAVLALLALWAGWSARRSLGPAMLAALLGAGALAWTPTPRSSQGRVLAAGESPYQSVRIVELGEGQGVLRQLQVNEALDSFQSVWQPSPGLLPEGYYYNAFCLPAWWSGARESWRVLVLGLGAGTAVRVLEGALPPGVELDSVGVEIDPLVVRLAREWMELAPDGPGRRVLADLDARTALRTLEGPFDEVVLDAYANQVEIPPHLVSLEFFREVRDVLAEGGWLAINIGGFDLEDPVVRAVSETVATAFEQEALVVMIPFSRNAIAFVRSGATPPLPGEPGWALPPGEVGDLLASYELPGRWRRVAPGERALVDDDSSRIEALQRASLERSLDALQALRR